MCMFPFKFSAFCRHGSWLIRSNFVCPNGVTEYGPLHLWIAVTCHWMILLQPTKKLCPPYSPIFNLAMRWILTQRCRKSYQNQNIMRSSLTWLKHIICLMTCLWIARQLISTKPMLNQLCLASHQDIPFTALLWRGTLVRRTSCRLKDYGVLVLHPKSTNTSCHRRKSSLRTSLETASAALCAKQCQWLG